MDNLMQCPKCGCEDFDIYTPMEHVETIGADGTVHRSEPVLETGGDDGAILQVSCARRGCGELVSHTQHYRLFMRIMKVYRTRYDPK